MMNSLPTWYRVLLLLSVALLILIVIFIVGGVWSGGGAFYDPEAAQSRSVSSAYAGGGIVGFLVFWGLIAFLALPLIALPFFLRFYRKHDRD